MLSFPKGGVEGGEGNAIFLDLFSYNFNTKMKPKLCGLFSSVEQFTIRYGHFIDTPR